VVLYAPTFRGATVRSASTPQNLDLAILGARIGGAAVLLVKEHPFVKERLKIPEAQRSFAIDVSDYPDINELMLISDIMVTDYSSAIFEYALLERPMAFFAPDLADYEEERSFFWDFRTGVPGPIFTESSALADWLAEPTHDLAPVRAFRARWIEIADGRSSERFARQVVAPLLAGRTPEVEWADGRRDSSSA
jgi:CDP-ribitol ribitolphosphotransferase